jgi:hypothetical protein
MMDLFGNPITDKTTKLLPVPVTEIIGALEREARNTDTDPRWIAASELRRMQDWQTRTLMCHLNVDPQSEDVMYGR